MAGSFFMANAQDMASVEKNLKKLTSKSFAGRGYVKNGDQKAAQFIASHFKKSGLEKIHDSYFQSYTFAINSFPEKIHLSINNQNLIAGDDFVVRSSAFSAEGNFPCLYLPLTEEQRKLDLSHYFLVGNKEFKHLEKDNIYQAKGFVFLQENQPSWSVFAGRDTSSYFVFSVNQKMITDSIKEIKFQVQNQYLANHQTQNVWGMVRGKTYPDSIIIISAHYDHLGMMGNVMYPGANDNGSGTVMMMELAKYFSQAENQPKVSLVFVAFSGEEAGLVGSRYLAQHFPFEKNKVQLLINLDMVGTGSEGITMVNGSVFPEILKQFQEINTKKGYLAEVKSRGESCNSDHCPFYENGIPAIFIYTRGPEATAYHIPQDDFSSVPLTKFIELFWLIRDYIVLH